MVIEDINQIEDILLNDEGFASYLTHLQEQKQHGMGDIGLDALTYVLAVCNGTINIF